jgi:hypothetical protein
VQDVEIHGGLEVKFHALDEASGHHHAHELTEWGLTGEDNIKMHIVEEGEDMD